MSEIRGVRGDRKRDKKTMAREGERVKHSRELGLRGSAEQYRP